MSEDEEVIREEMEERLAEQAEEQRLAKRRAWLQSLTQTDRDFIAIYGEDKWKKWKSLS